MPSENPREPGKRLNDFFNKVSKVLKDVLADPLDERTPFEQPQPAAPMKRREKKKSQRFRL